MKLLNQSRTKSLIIYLEVASLVEGVWGPEEGDLPLEEVVLVGEAGSDSFEGFLL